MNEKKDVNISEVVESLRALVESGETNGDALVESIIKDTGCGALSAVRLFNKAKKELGLVTKRIGFKDKYYSWIIETPSADLEEAEAFIVENGSDNDFKHRTHYFGILAFANNLRKAEEES
jgi:hypothetical protein